MARQAAESWSEETRFESAGCCGVIARLLGLGMLMITTTAIIALLVTQPPDRWQGAADPAAHPLALLVDPQHTLTVYAATEQGHILITHDGGQSWTPSSLGLPANTPISALASLPGAKGAKGLLAGTSAGAYLSLDGGYTWRSAGPGIPPHLIVDAISALPDGTLLAGTTSRGVYVWPAGAARWQLVAGLPSQSDIYAFLPLTQGRRALAALVSGGVYISQDDGRTWAESDQGMSGTLSGALSVNVFSFLAVPSPTDGDATILAGTSRGIYVSRDHGASWARSSVGIGTTRVISLARDPLTPTDVFAGADTGVYHSRDGGATWRRLGFGLPSEQHVGAIGVVHPVGGAQVVLASVDQLYRFPGQWPLASQPWRTLGIVATLFLALTLGALVLQWARAVLER